MRTRKRPSTSDLPWTDAPAVYCPICHRFVRGDVTTPPDIRIRPHGKYKWALGLWQCEGSGELYYETLIDRRNREAARHGSLT